MAKIELADVITRGVFRLVGHIDDVTVSPEFTVSPVPMKQVDNTPANDVFLDEIGFIADGDNTDKIEQILGTGGVDNGDGTATYTGSVRGIKNSETNNPPSTGYSRFYKSHENNALFLVDWTWVIQELGDSFDAGTTVNSAEAGETLLVNETWSLHTDGKLYKYHKSNYPNVVGIGNAGYASGVTAEYTTFGGLSTGHTGLTIGSKYYAENTGAITLTPSATTTVIGVAESATTIRLFLSSTELEKASSTEINTGTNDDKFISPKGTFDSNLAKFQGETLTLVESWQPMSGLTSAKRVETIIDTNNITSGRVKIFQDDVDTVDIASGTFSTRVVSISDNIKLQIMALDNDITNAVYASKSYDTSSEGTSQKGIRFNATGTKMYTCKGGSDKIYQYTLSTAFDISTASYDSVEFSFASQITTPAGFFISSDGKEFYVLPNGAPQVIHQYTMSTPWDLSTATYASKSFDYSAQVSATFGLTFSYAGDKMYISNYLTTQVIYEYTLSTPWDISTAAYSTYSKAVAEDSNPSHLSISKDGTTFIILGQTNKKAFRYTLSTPWRISTATYDSVEFDFASEVGANQVAGLDIPVSGGKMYFNTNTNVAYQYTLPATGSAEAVIIHN